YDGPVIFDCRVEKHENCFPMIPSGKPHNEMLLSADASAFKSGAVLVKAITPGVSHPRTPVGYL
ncbi:MAG: hypothetical protein WBP18_19980, partial [Paracoccaceae bacterium]